MLRRKININVGKASRFNEFIAKLIILGHGANVISETKPIFINIVSKD